MRTDERNTSVTYNKGAYASQFLKKELKEQPASSASAPLLKNLRSENLHLRDEVEELRGQLKIAVSKVPSLSKLLIAPSQSEGDNIYPISLHDLLLSEIEIKEAVIKACWLARYWGLACRFNLCSTIAAAQAAYWTKHAPSDQVLHDAARRISAALGCAQDSPGGVKERKRFDKTPGPRSALVTDVVELERAMRRIEALGVVRDVRCNVSRMALCATGGLSPGETGREDPFSGEALPLLSDLEAEEIQFQKAWLTYFWGRAALASLVTQVSRPQAEFLARSLAQPPAATDFKTLARAAQDLHLYGIEQELWRRRRWRC